MVYDIYTENIIKGIIVANSRTGITIQEIANVYYECTGENWSVANKGDSHVIQYLEQIEGILSIVSERNELLWYVRGKTLNSENHGQIYRANSTPDFDLSTSPHGNIPNTCIQHNTNNNFRNGRSNKTKVDRNNNGYNDINGNYEPRNSMQQKFSSNDRMHVNGHSLGSPINSDVYNSPSNQRKKYASLYNYELVGDDFFMEMAKIDLECSLTSRKTQGRRIYRSGLCISGQSIRDATGRLKRISNANNMKIIVNLGTVDILHGRDLADMCHDYTDLMKICERRGIQVIITTLAPLANRKHDPSDTQKWMQFNEFLMTRMARFTQVIDIVPCMVYGTNGKVCFDCYQADAKYVSGSNQPHMLWNRIGRQRILKYIKKQLHF